jgi:hypothetical protein
MGQHIFDQHVIDDNNVDDLIKLNDHERKHLIDQFLEARQQKNKSYRLPLFENITLQRQNSSFINPYRILRSLHSIYNTEFS